MLKIEFEEKPNFGLSKVDVRFEQFMFVQYQSLSLMRPPLIHREEWKGLAGSCGKNSYLEAAM